jgi:hypothetical protein
MNFMDELLAEVEEKEEKRKLELDRLRADQLLTAIGTLEQRADDINELVDSEIKLVEEYRGTELAKIQKKISWLSWNLEQFVRSSGEKTINLPHGSIKLRLGRDKVSIVELQQFLNDPLNQKFLKIIPESYEPDLSAIMSYVKSTGVIPTGAEFKEAETKYSHKTIRSESNGQNKQKRTSEARADTKSTDEIAIVAT